VKLAGMTASVAAGYAGNRVKSLFQTSADARASREASYRDTGERIARTLGELKGAAMKIGQMASIGSDMLPKELSDALAKLQKEAPPMPYEVIAAQIEAELGDPPERLFEWFDPEPFAAASIGQVHRARTDDGREVICKVQYPGVDSSVDSDLAHLKLAIRASGLMNRVHRRALDEVFAEIRERLHEELDYTNEAANVRMFRAHHADQPFVVVPDVVGERSAKRVLTLTFEPGDALTELDDERYPQNVRDLIGEHLFAVMASQLFELSAVQADPNPANFAFRPDGTVVLYDFGCVKRLTDAVMTPWKALVNAAFDEDYEACEQYLQVLGVREPGTPAPPVTFFKRWRDLFLEPLLSAEPYDFGAGSLHRRALEMVPETMRWVRSFRPPPELVFLDRTIVGYYGNLRALGARCAFMPELARHLGR
jgi:predicted unusual protein kinase regulating ubiquinone biosynthesis (AarF/ABC1/UbiB family)